MTIYTGIKYLLFSVNKESESPRAKPSFSYLCIVSDRIESVFFCIGSILLIFGKNFRVTNIHLISGTFKSDILNVFIAVLLKVKLMVPML